MLDCALPWCVLMVHVAQVAKLAGDQRATVAEKSFGRPFKRVVIAQCGALS